MVWLKGDSPGGWDRFLGSCVDFKKSHLETVSSGSREVKQGSGPPIPPGNWFWTAVLESFRGRSHNSDIELYVFW